MIGLRARLLFPTTFFLLIWGAYMVFHGRDGHVAPGVLLGILAVLVLVTVANVEVFLLRPLRGLKQAMQDLAGNTLTEQLAARDRPRGIARTGGGPQAVARSHA